MAYFACIGFSLNVDRLAMMTCKIVIAYKAYRLPGAFNVQYSKSNFIAGNLPTNMRGDAKKCTERIGNTDPLIKVWF